MEFFRCYQLDASGFSIGYENILAEDYMGACARADRFLSEGAGLDLTYGTSPIECPTHLRPL
jgi:hypothetical protein